MVDAAADGSGDGTPPIATSYAKAREDVTTESLGRRVSALEMASWHARRGNEEVHAFIWGVVFGVLIVVLVVRAVVIVERYRKDVQP